MKKLFLKNVLLVFSVVLLSGFSSAYAMTVSDDFSAYTAHEFINGKSNWISSDNYYSKGWWVETTDAPGPWIQFHPSPWPGGFALGSNYATFHATSPYPITSLTLNLDYNVLPRSDMQVFISSDNQSWLDITSAIGITPSPAEPAPVINAIIDLTSYISTLNIQNDVYIKFTSAAYSASGWGAGIFKIAVVVNDVVGLDLNPNTLNLQSQGNYMTGHIYLDNEIAPDQIRLDTIKIVKIKFMNGPEINVNIPAEESPISLTSKKREIRFLGNLNLLDFDDEAI